MNNEQRARFLKLIDFLKELPENQFSFHRIVAAHANGCGTVCCAIGWTPALFPDLVEWCTAEIVTQDENFWVAASIHSKKNKHVSYVQIADELFGLGSKASIDLFTPNRQYMLHPTLPICGPDAKPKKVAAMLVNFLELRDSGLIE